MVHFFDWLQVWKFRERVSFSHAWQINWLRLFVICCAISRPNLWVFQLHQDLWLNPLTSIKLVVYRELLSLQGLELRTTIIFKFNIFTVSRVFILLSIKSRKLLFHLFFFYRVLRFNLNVTLSFILTDIKAIVVISYFRDHLLFCLLKSLARSHIIWIVSRLNHPVCFISIRLVRSWVILDSKMSARFLFYWSSTSFQKWIYHDFFADCGTVSCE